MSADENNPFCVLLTEDNQGDIILFKRKLQRSPSPYDLRIVDNSAELFNLIIDNQTNRAWPHIVLLDINMPTVSGFQALNTLRQFPQMKDVPIFMLTSSRAENDVAEAKKLGANGYIIKGTEFSLEDLISYADQVKDQGTWLSVG